MKRAHTRLPYSLLIGLVAMALFSSHAQAWWKNDWTGRKKITLDTTAQGAAVTDPIGTVTILLRLHDGDFPFSAAKGDGADLRFVADDDKTPLAFHIEKYDSLLNEAFVWVKIPDLAPGAQTSFWLYYGNSSDHVGRADDPKASYDADTVLVYHFGEHGQPAHDFTGNGNNTWNGGIPADGSMIGTGLRLDGRGGLTIPASSSLEWRDQGELTWSAWTKFNAKQPRAIIFNRAAGDRAFLIGIDNGVPFVEVKKDDRALRSPAGSPVIANTWVHLAVVASGSKMALYVNGEPYSTLNVQTPALSGPSFIGGEDVSGEPGYRGELDELEISRVARSPGFIKLAAIAQGGDRVAKLLAIGQEEQATNWLSWLSTGYFGIILKSLTPDGWAVICILAIMAVVSWCVMIAKARYLNATSAGNVRFMKEWRQVAADLTVLESDDLDKIKSLGGRVDAAGQRSMRNASVYRIYHIGAEEIRHRLGAQNGGTKFLSARSIQAIRASLDTGLVRESQRLNSKMVLLTIAISGGPFLGLFGTVVGVMITFAAIAAAGDVNVNAIAPGIAAALVATVAGLAVAIPSLFGYNYLLSRVKDATNDMRVFIDEFVSKMAEAYPESPE